MVSYYDSLGSMFPTAAPPHPRHHNPSVTGSSAYFNPYAAAAAAANYPSSNHHHHPPPVSHHGQFSAGNPPPPPPPPPPSSQYNPDLNSNMYSGTHQFGTFEGGWPSPSWSFHGGNRYHTHHHVPHHQDWNESNNENLLSKGDYSPARNEPGTGEDSSENANSSDLAIPPASPSYNNSHASSESPSVTPTPTNSYQYAPFLSQQHQPPQTQQQLSSGGGSEDSPHRGSLESEGLLIREDSSAVPLPASSLSPPPSNSSSRPQPARSPYEWMKKPSYTNQNDKSGRTRTKDKYRVVYSDHQRLELEKEFHYSRYITIRRKAELANNVGLSERQVKIWFQNRRAKERRALKKTDDSVSKEKLSECGMSFNESIQTMQQQHVSNGMLPNSVTPPNPSFLPHNPHFPAMKYE